MQLSQERHGARSVAYLMAACVIGTIAISGCAVTGVITDTSCNSFEPIHASITDTIATQRQVIEHNAAYDSICGKAPLK